MANFNDFRFEGLNYRERSNKYFTMNRVSEDETKIVVKVDEGHVQKTKYGYALILDDSHVVFLKDWQVDINYFGCEVLLTKQYFVVKEWGEFPEYCDNDQNLNWETWLETAKEQESFVDENGTKMNPVQWQR